MARRKPAETEREWWGLKLDSLKLAKVEEVDDDENCRRQIGPMD